MEFLFIVIISAQEFSRRTDQQFPESVVVQKAIDARQLMGVGDMSAIQRQKILYARDGDSGAGGRGSRRATRGMIDAATTHGPRLGHRR